VIKLETLTGMLVVKPKMARITASKTDGKLTLHQLFNLVSMYHTLHGMLASQTELKLPERHRMISDQPIEYARLQKTENICWKTESTSSTTATTMEISLPPSTGNT
jgi:hypothetical protein